MDNKEINFVLDKQLKNLNENVEKLVYNLNNPLSGEKIHIIKTFTKELMKSYSKRSQARITKHPQKEALIVSTMQENYELPSLDMDIFDQDDFYESQSKQFQPPQFISKEKVNFQSRFPSAPEIKRETEIKEKKIPPKPVFTPKPIEEERIPLITSSITSEEMAYAIKKGFFYIVNEVELTKDEVVTLNFMKPYVEKNNSLFQNKNKFIKLMKRASRKNKIDSESLSPSKLRYFLIKHTINFGLIDPILYDSFITKIICEGPELKLKVIRQDKELITNLEYKTAVQLNEFLQNLARKKGKLLSERNPEVYLEFENFKITASLGIGENPSTFALERII